MFLRLITNKHFRDLFIPFLVPFLIAEALYHLREWGEQRNKNKAVEIIFGDSPGRSKFRSREAKVRVESVKKLAPIIVHAVGPLERLSREQILTVGLQLDTKRHAAAST